MLLACEFWACKSFIMTSQVVKQAVKLCRVSLGGCFKYFVPFECFTASVVNTDTKLPGEQKKIKSQNTFCSIKYSHF